MTPISTKKPAPWMVAVLSMFIALFGMPAHAGLPLADPGYVAPRIMSRPVQAYPFIHYDGCTGACNFVVIDGKSIPVAFTPDSDPDAVKLLWALKLEIFFPNTGEASPRLHVVGQLFDGISRFPQTGDDYHEFLLKRWYLATPFVEDRRYSEEMREQYMGASEEELPLRLRHLKPVLRTKLRRTDFEDVEGMRIDLKELAHPDGGVSGR